MYLLKQLYKPKKINNMKLIYKTIDISNLTGINEAEKLQINGWKIINFGLNLLVFEKKIETKL